MASPAAAATVLTPSDRDAILAALDQVPDPEIPAISLTDLGIVREVRTTPPAVVITPTYTGCPATLVIETSVRTALDEAGYPAVPVETSLSPPWSTDEITERGRERLLAYGIAPPPRGAAQRTLRGGDTVACPRCGSTDTTEVSRFGSTPCKALWRCRACCEPFDRFKCH